MKLVTQLLNPSKWLHFILLILLLYYLSIYFVLLSYFVGWGYSQWCLGTTFNSELKEPCGIRDQIHASWMQTCAISPWCSPSIFLYFLPHIFICLHNVPSVFLTLNIIFYFSNTALLFILVIVRCMVFHYYMIAHTLKGSTFKDFLLLNLSFLTHFQI